MKKEALVTIVIPVLGRFDLLSQCLAAIPNAAKKTSYEVILVDNASPKEEAIKFYGDVYDYTVIRNQTNVGFPKACNQGARKSKSPLLFFLNSDVILGENAIDELVKSMDDPSFGIVGMLLLFPEYAEGLRQDIRPSGKVQHVGMDTNVRGDWIHTFVGWDSNNPKIKQQKECYAVTGAALMTRRRLFIQVGGFDEEYGFGTYEDVDYAMKIRELGYNVMVNVNSVGVHYTGASSEAYRIGFPVEKNKMLFLGKWAQKLQWSEYARW